MISHTLLFVDPTGMLKEGEIYYRFSRPRRDPRTSMLVHVLEGDVLVYTLAYTL